MMDTKKPAYLEAYNFLKPQFKNIDLGDLLNNISNYKIVSGDLDNYFSIRFETKNLSSLIFVRTFLEIEGFTVMGDKDIYRYIQIYNKYSKLLDKNDPLLKEFYKDSIYESCYGIDDSSDYSYYFYFYPVSERRNIKTLYDFNKIYTPLIEELLDKEEARLSLIQQDKVISGEIMINYYGYEEEPENISNINLNTEVSSLRDTYILASILKILAKTKDELDELNIKIF